MLTSKEMTEFKKLQAKAKEYVPLTEQEIEGIEQRATKHFDGMEVKMGIMMKAWNVFATMLSSLSDDNLRLSADVQYWKSISKLNKEI